MSLPLPQFSSSSCGSGPGSVPVFNCIVILRQTEPGRIEGRVANLAGLTVAGSNERDVLMQLTRRFRERVRNGDGVPWIDPPESPAPGEQLRFIPVHL